MFFNADIRSQQKYSHGIFVDASMDVFSVVCLCNEIFQFNLL